MFSNLRKLHGLAMLLSLLCFSSCEYIKAVDEVVAPDKNKTLYMIKKGEHATNSFIKKIEGDAMGYEVTFDSSAVYQTVNPENQGDINKLFGTSDCGTQHHMNSARFGWRWFNGRLEIHAYTYANGQRHSKLVSTVEIGKPYTYEIKFEADQYVFKLNDVRVAMPRNCSGAIDGYMLFPYFGGDELAPHDITITLNHLY